MISKDTIIENLKFDPRNPLSISSSNFSSNQNDNIILIAEKDRDSTLWIGTTNGLNNYNLKTKSNKRFYKDNSRESISSNFIYDYTHLIVYYLLEQIKVYQQLTEITIQLMKLTF